MLRSCSISSPFLVRCSRIALGILRRCRQLPEEERLSSPPPPCGGAIPDTRSTLLCAARASRLESAAVVVTPRGRTPHSLLFHAAARDSRRSQRPFVRCSRIALGIRRRCRRSQRKNASAPLLLHAAARDSRRSQRLCRSPVWLRSRAWVIHLHLTCSCSMRSGFSAWLTVLRWSGDLGWIPLSLKNCCSISRPAVGSNV